MNVGLLAFLIVGVVALAFYIFRRPAQILPLQRRISVPVGIPSYTTPAPQRKEKKTAPLSGYCATCNKQVTLPFRCSYCDQLFCPDHRLPEDHGCDAV